MAQDKPLFIPLKTEYFNQFKAGTKTTEYRLYGARWNDDTVKPGRPVVLSKGYGKHARLSGHVGNVEARNSSTLDLPTQEAVQALYGDGDHFILCIGIADIQEIAP